jgi:hypothetical protein
LARDCPQAAAAPPFLPNDKYQHKKKGLLQNLKKGEQQPFSIV